MKEKITILLTVALMYLVSSPLPGNAAYTIVVVPAKTTSTLPIKTGQERCTVLNGGVWVWADNCDNATPPGQDGQLQSGTAWPDPRYTDNGDGTVSDNLTGLVWLKDANCPQGTEKWSDALTFAADLHDGWTGDPANSDCGLADGSSPGDWRIPTIRELLSIIDYENYNPALDAQDIDYWTAATPFTGVEANNYWTSTSYAYSPISAWYVHLKSGDTGVSNKSVSINVWPVRNKL